MPEHAHSAVGAFNLLLAANAPYTPWYATLVLHTRVPLQAEKQLVTHNPMSA